jgi:uncharacterized protein YjbI with pentapeptide repeats
MLVLLVAILVATFPGEGHDQNRIAMIAWVPTAWNLAAYERGHEETSQVDEGKVNRVGRLKAKLKGLLQPKSLYELLFSGEVNDVRGTRDSLWDNTLVLPDQDFVNDEELDKTDTTIILRGRDLRGAVLIRADLRKADFTGANFDDAQLTGSRLDQAKFGCAKRGQKVIEDARTCGASLLGTQLAWARLRGANFNEANLQGANLEGAQLQIATLEEAKLQGAFLKRAQLIGASLTDAQLQGALLDGAHLHGASLQGANFEGASLVNAVVWDTIHEDASHLQEPRLEWSDRWCLLSEKFYLDYAEKKEMPLNGAAASKLIDDASSDSSKALSKRIRSKLSFLRDSATPEDEFWKSEQSETKMPQDQIAVFLGIMACGREKPVAVVRGMIGSGRIRATGSYASSITSSFGDPVKCPPAADLSDQDMALLAQQLKSAESAPAQFRCPYELQLEGPADATAGAK